MFDELKCEITNTETLKAIHQLQNGTSAGPNLATNECFVTIAHFTLQCFFRTEVFQQTWSEGYIILLHKKWSTSDVANFRGTSITLLSVTGKLYNKVLNNRRSDLAEQNTMFMLTHKLVLEQVIAQFIKQLSYMGLFLIT